MSVIDELRTELTKSNPHFIDAVDICISNNILDIQCVIDVFESPDTFYKCMRFATLAGLIVHVLPAKMDYLIKQGGVTHG